LTPELVRARGRTVLLTARYNESFGKGPDQREDLLRQLFAKVGCRVYFEPSLRCEFGFNITIGNDFYANFDCIILDGGAVEIVDNVLFGPRVGI
jgi:maltose O-acetyltransferase